MYYRTHQKTFLCLAIFAIVVSGCTIKMLPPAAPPSAPAGAAVSPTPVVVDSAVTVTSTLSSTTDSTLQVAVPTPESTSAPAESAPTNMASPEEIAATFELPVPAVGKFNVAFIVPGPVGDGGWNYAHNQGRQIIEQYLGERVHTSIVESVPEGLASEIVMRNLALAGFDAIFSCSFGYMDPTATIAAEFPQKYFVHVSGFKNNGKNFASLFGSMEDMKYLAGMIAGARAAEDGSKRLGYVAPFPLPEVTRYINATALGMRRTCPDCVMDIRWTFSWFDPAGERQAATEMLDAGATVILTGADTTGPVEVAGERGLWGVGYDSNNACEVDIEHCLTTTYWDWGQVYIWLINKMLNGKFVGQDYYFDADSNGVGITGFMVGQQSAAGVPASVVPQVKQLLDQMLRGQFNRFDLFTGPINDNKGQVVVPVGTTLTQSDLEGLQGIPNRQNCTICMDWLAEGVLPELELPTMQ